MKNFAIWPLFVLLLTIAVNAPLARTKPTQKALDSALFSAIRNNDVKRAKSLLERGANVNARDAQNSTPLIQVSFVGDPEDETTNIRSINFLKLFLRYKPDVNLADAEGNTALMQAAQGSAEATRLLIDKGANVNAQSKIGNTALMSAAMWACEGPCSAPDCAKILLDAGANPNLANEDGDTALIFAAQLPLYGPLTAKDGFQIAKMLLARGADAKARSRNGNTALKWAKAGGNSAFIRLIERAQIAN